MSWYWSDPSQSQTTIGPLKWRFAAGTIMAAFIYAYRDDSGKAIVRFY